MVDNKTSHLALPLPDLSNMQDEDVPRIGQALRLIDAHAQGVDAQVQSVEAALDGHGKELQKLGSSAQADSARIDQLVEDQGQESRTRAAADNAAAGLIDTLAEAQEAVELRVDAVEKQNTQQDTRLTAVEGVTSQQSKDIAANAAALGGKANSDLSNATNNAIKYCFHACDIKSQNTNGGTSASAAWQTRDLNTINENTLGAVLAGNRFTLTPGTYRIKASVPAFRTTQFCGALYDYTHGQYIIRGTSESSGPDATTSARSFIDGVFTVSATTTFELRMYTLGAVGTWGLGYAVNAASTPEKFSEVQIWKV